MNQVVTGSQQVDIEALMCALPVSALEPNTVATLEAFIDMPTDREPGEVIRLLEPPAGQCVPYIDPVAALETLMHRQGIASENAKTRAFDTAVRMKADIPENHWVTFFDTYEPESPECLPLPDFVSWLRKENRRVNETASRLKVDEHALKQGGSEGELVPADILDFFEKATEVTMRTPMFRGPDNRDDAWSLENMPVLPPPKAMIEFVPGPAWDDFESGNWETGKKFLRWREAMRPIAQALEAALGEPVYYFKDLDDELDDDDVHRFLVLHWCCSLKPESSFVRYLLKVTGASDVEALKAALIDPANYTHPFKMNSAFTCLEARSCRIKYLPANTHRTVAVMFMTDHAREFAQSLLTRQIGAHVVIVAPKELITDEWIKDVTRFCRGWEMRYVNEDWLDKPIEILASIDEFYIIANEPTPGHGFNLMLSDSAEDLLWMAFELGVEARYYYVDGGRLSNPESCLERRGVPERVAVRKVQRAAFTRQLKEIRLHNDFGSSALWNEECKMLSYDQLDLPFPLVRRIAAWQRDFDNTMNPPDEMGSDAWWDCHRKEEIETAKLLQEVLGENPVVKLHRKQGWVSVDEIVQAKVGEA